jgi:hypothetical protein
VISEIYRCLQCCVAWGIDVLNMSFSYVGSEHERHSHGKVRGADGQATDTAGADVVALANWKLPSRSSLASLVTGGPDVGINGPQDAALAVIRVDVVIADVVFGYLYDLIDIAVVAGIERIEFVNVERYRIPPSYACAWAAIDADIQSRGDGQFR